MLNPAQQRIIDLLGAPRGGKPEFKRDLAHQLRAELEYRLAPLADALDAGGTGALLPGKHALYMNKHTLGRVLGCERYFLAEQSEPFAWSPPLARGSVSHKAIELSLHWQKPPDALDLVDKALERLAESDSSLGEYVRSCSDVEKSELRAQANQRVAGFLEGFPPLKAAWTPVTEPSLRATFLDGSIVLSGRPDMTLGQPDGNKAGKVLIDFKSGGSSPVHIEDLRFYALIETLRIGVPPRMVATYYLDSGCLHNEPVSVGILKSAVDRIADGTQKYVEITGGRREPTTSPGYLCRWCPFRSECADGIAYLEHSGIGPNLDTPSPES